MTRVYAMGYQAGRCRWPVGSCPYEGATDASMALQQQWMDGYFDGLTKHVPKRRKGPRVTYRKTVRVRWPRSEYARERVRAALLTE